MDQSVTARSMTESEAARYVRMSQSYLRQSRMDGDRENRTPGPPFLKIGRSVRYLVDDLDAWLEQFRPDNGKVVTMANTTSPITVMLGRLEKVIDRGGGQYSALCPAHEDKSPSLSIAETDDRLLIHCFAGCHPNEIVAAVGLSLADLFNTPLTKDCVKPLPRQRRFNDRALLLVLNHESTKVAIAAHDMAEGRLLSDDDRKALISAHQRSTRVVELVS